MDGLHPSFLVHEKYYTMLLYAAHYRPWPWTHRQTAHVPF